MMHAPSTSKRSACFPALPRFLTRLQLLTRISSPASQGAPYLSKRLRFLPADGYAAIIGLQVLSGDAVQEARSVLGRGR
jgi:hypothetical protein